MGRVAAHAGKWSSCPRVLVLLSNWMHAVFLSFVAGPTERTLLINKKIFSGRDVWVMTEVALLYWLMSIFLCELLLVMALKTKVLYVPLEKSTGFPKVGRVAILAPFLLIESSMNLPLVRQLPEGGVTRGAQLGSPLLQSIVFRMAERTLTFLEGSMGNLIQQFTFL